MKNVALGLTALTALFVGSQAHALDLSWDGFGSAYYAQATNRPDFLDFSLVGLNARAKVNDQLSFVGQLVAVGGVSQQSSYNSSGLLQPSNFVPFFQFAYAKYTPAEGWTVKLGRQAYPILMAGETFRETFYQPYRTRPTVIYNIPALSAIDGVSVAKDFDVAGGKLEAQVFGGNGVNDFPYSSGETYSANDVIGGKVIV
jgi:hypothetical protein